jgi:hypothetical protein
MDKEASDWAVCAYESPDQGRQWGLLKPDEEDGSVTYLAMRLRSK